MTATAATTTPAAADSASPVTAASTVPAAAVTNAPATAATNAPATAANTALAAAATTVPTLGLDEDMLHKCVACGLCLPHCPTYRVSGKETHSPRGRIALMQVVQEGIAPLTDEIIESFATCIGCCGCETACPGDVPYGKLIEGTKVAVEQTKNTTPRSLRAGLWILTKPRLLRALSRLLALGQRVGLSPPRRFGLPKRLSIRRNPLHPRAGVSFLERVAPQKSALPRFAKERRDGVSFFGRVAPKWLPVRSKSLHRRPSPRTHNGVGPRRLPIENKPFQANGGDVWLFTGCVMDAWQSNVHLATQKVIELTNTTVRLSGDVAGCCGALHLHNGLKTKAKKLAQRVISSMSDDKPILVNSAGCGAALKGYGELLDTDQAREFSKRVYDIHTWLEDRRSSLPTAGRKIGGRVAVQDPCHLRHVQKQHLAVRSVLEPYVEELVELDDNGLCCGAGGSFAVLQPKLAAEVRSEKIKAVKRTNADLVASANPGCAMYLAAGGLEVRHPMELIAEALPN